MISQLDRDNQIEKSEMSICQKSLGEVILEKCWSKRIQIHLSHVKVTKRKGILKKEKEKKIIADIAIVAGQVQTLADPTTARIST